MSTKNSTPTSLGGAKVQVSGSSTGRNKVALKPGKSLMDWIRFTHSGKDLTSVGGKILDVTAEELGQHNTKEDAWICLRGKVYNVTPYFEYHPGGEDELMRGAGKDATDLFNEIHQWVNAESMLKKCYVGRMNMSSLWLQKATSFPAPKFPAPVSKASAAVKSVLPKCEIDGAVETTADLKAVENGTEVPKDRMVPKFDWSQSERCVSISLHSKEDGISLKDVVVDLVARDLFIMLHVNSYVYNLHVELEDSVSPVYDVKISKSNDVAEIILNKDNCEGTWEELGKPLKHHNTFIANIDKEIRYRPCKLISQTPVTHNTVLLVFELPSGTMMVIPMGCHVFLKASVEGIEIVRSYTPVLQSLDIPSSHSSLTDGRLIHLMIKIYPDGALTPLIGKCKIGETFFISDYSGDFSEKRLQECSSLILLAAGTGFTPMVKLIHWALEVEDNQNRSVVLAFFNKTEKDILWRSELDNLCQKHTRFQVNHILSEPEEEWMGRKGRITVELLQDMLPNSIKDPGVFVCVCGPSTFTQLTLQYLEDVGCSKSSICAFCG